MTFNKVCIRKILKVLSHFQKRRVLEKSEFFARRPKILSNQADFDRKTTILGLCFVDCLEILVSKRFILIYCFSSNFC